MAALMLRHGTDESGHTMLRRLRGLSLVLILVVLAGACTSDPAEEISVASVDATAVPVIVTAPTDVPTATDQTPAEDSTAVAQPSPPEGPQCSDVPTFYAADTVSTACVGSFAVAPELFANNAGWHLFEAQDGQWAEIDYALTCCQAGEVPFTELLSRNGIDEAAIAQFCAATGVGPDSVTGCDTGGEDQAAPAPEGTWLRVNGLGDHDFGSVDTEVIESVEATFGPAIQVNEASECGAGPMTILSFDNFSLQFQSGQFVGWFYETSMPPLATPSGVTTGIAESDLVVAYEGVEIFESTLGAEFAFTVPAGTIGGFFDQPGGNVTSLHAGVNCFFR